MRPSGSDGSPNNEAAVLGLTGQILDPMAKGSGERIAAEADGFRVEPLD